MPPVDLFLPFPGGDAMERAGSPRARQWQHRREAQCFVLRNHFSCSPAPDGLSCGRADAGGTTGERPRPQPGRGPRPLAAAGRHRPARGQGRGRPGAHRGGQDADLRALVQPGQEPRPGHLHRAHPRAGQRQARRMARARLGCRHRHGRPGGEPRRARAGRHAGDAEEPPHPGRRPRPAGRGRVPDAQRPRTAA